MRPEEQSNRMTHAKTDIQLGRRAYSDSFNHVVVRMYRQEYGFDLACAIRLREDLDRAIRNAALPDDEYIKLYA
ncbi:MAG: hypothetical protein ABW134_11690 [Candidatus Thiodiazotropha endolucinida]